MKIELERRIHYSDVGPDFQTRLGVLLRLFQDTAAYHSEQAGHGIPKLANAGLIWMLSKLHIEVNRYPAYGETLTLRSWSRGSQGFKMPRDFTIHAGSNLIASGSSIWFIVNTRSKKIERVPAEIDAGYQAEPGCLALAAEVEDWSPYDKFDAASDVQLQTRPSDCDASRHVNNTVYWDYACAAFAASGWAIPDKASSLKMQFSREIPADIPAQSLAALRALALGTEVENDLFGGTARRLVAAVAVV